MGKTSRRKLFLFGRYSLALLPPKKWLTELGVKHGDEVTIELDRAKRRLVVRLDSSPSKTGPTTTPTKPAAKPDKSEGWEPIPQI